MDSLSLRDLNVSITMDGLPGVRSLDRIKRLVLKTIRLVHLLARANWIIHIRCGSVPHVLQAGLFVRPFVDTKEGRKSQDHLGNKGKPPW